MRTDERADSTGSIRSNGVHVGMGFAVTPTRVLTALHVVREKFSDRLLDGLTFAPGSGGTIDVERIESDPHLDAAVLFLRSEAPAVIVPGRGAAPGDRWEVTGRPRPTDPMLHGTVRELSIPRRNGRGLDAVAMQLAVDESVGTYTGYSGSPVHLTASPCPVVGILVEEALTRLKQASPRDPVPAANVLYATPIEPVLARFGLSAHVKTALPEPPCGEIVGNTRTPARRVADRSPAPGETPGLASVLAGHYLARRYTGEVLSRVTRSSAWTGESASAAGTDVIWVHGGSGVGKTVILLQAAIELADAGTSVHLLMNPGQLGEALEFWQHREERVVLALHDAWANGADAARVWADALPMLDRWPGPRPIMLTTGLPEHLEQFRSFAAQYGRIGLDIVHVDRLTADERGEYLRWYARRTGSEPLEPPDETVFVQLALRLELLRDGGQSPADLAIRMLARAQKLGIDREFLSALAVNRRDLPVPPQLFRGKKAELEELLNRSLLGHATDGGRILSPMIAEALYTAVVPPENLRSAAVHAVTCLAAETHPAAQAALIRGFTNDRVQRDSPPLFAAHFLEEIWDWLAGLPAAEVPPAVLFAWLAVAPPEGWEPSADRVYRIARSWMADSDPAGGEWAHFSELAWRFAPEDDRDGLADAATAWLDTHAEGPQWTHMWTRLWAYRHSDALVALARGWLATASPTPGWGFLFEPLYDSGVREPWLLTGALRALQALPVTRGEVREWGRIRALLPSPQDEVDFLLTRSCRSNLLTVCDKAVREISRLARHNRVTVDLDAIDGRPADPGRLLTLRLLTGTESALPAVRDAAFAAFGELSPADSEWPVRFVLAHGSATDEQKRELLARAVAWLPEHEESPDFSSVWRRLHDDFPQDHKLAGLGRAWLEQNGERPDWSHVFRRVIGTTPDDDRLAQIGVAWAYEHGANLDCDIVLESLAPAWSSPIVSNLIIKWLRERPDRRGWNYLWRAAVGAAADRDRAELVELASQWLAGHEDEPGWVFVWTGLAREEVGGADHFEVGYDWLAGRPPTPEWPSLWQFLFEHHPPRRADLTRLGLALLTDGTDHPGWERIWEALCADQAADEAFIEAGMRWLDQHPGNVAWNHIWFKLLDNAEPARPRLCAIARRWLAGNPHHDGWSYVMIRLLTITDGDLGSVSELARRWLTGHPESRSWAHVWDALAGRLGLDSELVDAGRDWLPDHAGQPRWTSVFTRLFEGSPTDRPKLRDIGVRWLGAHLDDRGWQRLWKLLAEDQPGRETLDKLGRSWLDGHQTNPAWSFVWQHLSARYANDDEFIALGWQWLDGHEQLTGWSYIWLKLFDVADELRPELQATALRWLDANQSSFSWSYVWKRLLDDGSDTERVLTTGVAWLAGHESQPGWPHVWGPLSEHRGFDRRVLEAGESWLDVGPHNSKAQQFVRTRVARLKRQHQRIG
jgi:hypothetical protein